MAKVLFPFIQKTGGGSAAALPLGLCVETSLCQLRERNERVYLFVFYLFVTQHQYFVQYRGMVREV
jgi:hypothetical protein